MKQTIRTILIACLLTTSLGACTTTQVDTTIGGAAGAGLGYAVTGGSAVGAIVGGGAGALIGHEIGKQQTRRGN